MKLISFMVPCYNSYAYMGKCIESLLPGGDDIEIIIVDDGSSDKTAELADTYERHYPNIIKAIHQENKGHGGAINTGLAAATGKFFKVVDSDDWVDKDAYQDVLSLLRKFDEDGTDIDMLLTNYVYDKISEDKHRHMSYPTLFPENEVITWDDMKRNIVGFTILMHSVIYKTSMLKECGMTLPEHTFYEDNLYVYYPLPFVKHFYYLNEDFYHYYIGREGQSVSEQIMISRLNQQLKVNYLLLDAHDPWAIEPEHLRNYMLDFLEMITVVSTALAYVSNSEENLEKVRALWEYIKNKDIRTYKHLRYGLFGGAMNLPGKLGRYISVKCYSISQKFMGFN